MGLTTEFGKITRKIRFDHGELLKHMSDLLGVTPSFLSAVECGRRKPPSSWADQIIEHYDLSNVDAQELRNSIFYSSDKIDVSHLSFNDKCLVGRFSQLLSELNNDEVRNVFERLPDL